MTALYDALEDLSSVHDPELSEGYRRYESLLAAALTPEQMEEYAAYIRQSGTVHIFEDLAPAELATLPAEMQVIAAAVQADQDLTMENRRVVALLSQRGQDAATPDPGTPKTRTSNG
jgi:hypothetical protein